LNFGSGVAVDAEGGPGPDEALQAAAPVGIAFLDLDFRHLRANGAYASITGRPASQLIGRSLQEVLPQHWHRIAPLVLEAVESGRPASDLGISETNDTPSGQSRHWQFSFFPVRQDGRTSGLGVTATNVTELKLAELRLHEAQAKLLHVSRLSAMGQMSSVLAHEVNQPLTAVCNYIRAGLLVLESSGQPVSPQIRDIFEKAAQQADRASEIIRNLREFARTGEAVQRPENLKDVVKEALSLALLGARDRRPEVHLQVEDNATWASINRVQIQQVLVNLLNNAIEAMGQSAKREIDVSARLIEHRLIRVSIADTGSGLDKFVAGNLFKPFTTSKPEGMGVGLAISRSIVKAHGGDIWAEPNAAGGTVFHFTVPQSPLPAFS
jgi:two-component system sensor kinase FixL